MVSNTDCNLEVRLNSESGLPSSTIERNHTDLTNLVGLETGACITASSIDFDSHSELDRQYMLFPGCLTGDRLTTGDTPSSERNVAMMVLSQEPLEYISSADSETGLDTKLHFLTSVRDILLAMVNQHETQSADMGSVCDNLFPLNFVGSSPGNFQSLKLKIIETIDALNEVNLEISVLQESYDSHTVTLSSLTNYQSSLDTEAATIKSKLEAAEALNRDLSFRLNHVLNPSLNELNLEKQSMDEVAKNELEVMEIEERELTILRSQLEDRQAILKSLEDDKTSSNIGKILVLQKVVYDQSNDPLQNDLNLCLQKVEYAYSEAVAKNRKLRMEVGRLEHEIWLKTETRLKPTLDRIVSQEVEHQRLVFEKQVIDKTVADLVTAGKRLQSQLDSLENERGEIVEKTRIAKNQLKELTLTKSELEESYRRIIMAQLDSQKSIGEDQENLRKVTCDRNEALQSIEKHVNQMKQNIVEISSLKEKREKIGEMKNDARKKFESLSKINREMEKKVAHVAGRIDAEHSTLSECESLVCAKKTEIANLEDLVRRERIELNETRRKLDISKIEIAKFRGIGSRVAETRTHYDQLVAERRDKECRLIEIVKFNKTKPNANISEIFVLTTDSINERIRKTETRLVESCERLEELQLESDNINSRKKELEEKTRNNILFMQKASKLKFICMQIDRQVIAREAEIIVYTAKCDELREELSQTAKDIAPEISVKKPKAKIIKPQSTEKKESDDWLGVIVR